MLIEHFKKSEHPRYLIADSKLYSEGNAINLKYLQFITRIPGINKAENTAISDAIKLNQWNKLDGENKYCVLNKTQHEIEQRWIIVFSNKARERAKKSLDKRVEKEKTRIEKSLRHLSHKPFNCLFDAEQELLNMNKKCKYHRVSLDKVEERYHH